MMTMALAYIWIIVMIAFMMVFPANSSATKTTMAGSAAVTTTTAVIIREIRHKLRLAFFDGGPPDGGPPGGPPGGHHSGWGGYPGSPTGPPPGWGGQGGYHAGGWGFGPWGGPGYFGPGTGGWGQFNPYYGPNGYGPGGQNASTGGWKRKPGRKYPGFFTQLVDWSCFVHDVSNRFLAAVLIFVEIAVLVGLIVGAIALFCWLL